MEFGFNFNAAQPSGLLTNIMEECKNHPKCEGCRISKEVAQEDGVAVWCENTANVNRNNGGQ